MRYLQTGRKKEKGIVYTPTDMAEWVAYRMLEYKRPDRDSEIFILDPAAGEGELLAAMIKALGKHKKRITAIGYETEEEVGKQAQKRLERLFPEAKIEIRTEDFLEATENGCVERFDFVIANPPYIRTQILGSNQARSIAEKLSLTGRIDLYYAFLYETKKVLKQTGIAGYITSNKFLTIKAGTSVRNYMLQEYQIHHILDLGDTKLFSAAILPCITIFSPGNTKDKTQVAFTSVYQEGAKEIEAVPVQSVWEPILKQGVFEIPDGRKYSYQQGILQSAEPDSLWTMESKEKKEWLEQVERKTEAVFSDIGKIRVGIKTTADEVFIGEKWEGEKANLEWLRPLITHRNAGQIVANSTPKWQVLYTHTIKDGKKLAYDIEQYPKTKAYLLQHYHQLAGRSYLKKAHRNWYEIWVPQNPEAWQHRKIVFRDISEQPEFWLDETGAVVNGDCYWIEIFPEVSEEMVYLALAVANSSFIETYYDLKFHTKLYAGKRRYQAQYVRQFPLPCCNTESAQAAIAFVKKIIAKGKEITLRDKMELDNIVEKLFF